MLDQETKRKIESARDILVGKVPDPKAQVDQIATALMYKFMDDMDREAVQHGGRAKFFAGDYRQYSWAALMDKRLPSAARLDLYVRAIRDMPKNPGIPQLFRDIFKGAVLPFTDVRTLNLFLTEIDGFVYDHSENLGDAFEYLLSIMGTQGKMGQFRTPRHIIDFMVEVVAPQKNETILDPACGTAGFLISAYKHILRQNPALTPQERTKLTKQLVGYDISPDMVKLALVNMYLHRFVAPKIHEYDTLTSEDRWEHDFDVVLANPPFMTPKGGIDPHNKFRIRANRAEVLFVNYIAEHLSIKGRAGIIVPEGIVFKINRACKNLRKILMEEWGLFAVASLPSGVFKPYSGVKTCILFIDRELAKKTNKILFVKVKNDGFDLGDQRREIKHNDLPACLSALQQWQKNQTIAKNNNVAFAVEKTKIAENGEYNLTAERQVPKKPTSKTCPNQKWPMAEIAKLANLGRGRVISKEYIQKNAGNYPVYSSQTQNNGVFGRINTYDFEGEFVTWTTDGANAGRVFYRNGKFNCTNVCGTIKIVDYKKTSPKYLAYVLNTCTKPHVNIASGNPKLMNNVMAKIQIPLPPLSVQKEIVAEIEQWQKIIDGAKQVTENWKPHIRIASEWPTVALGDFCNVSSGNSAPQDKNLFINGKYPFYRTSDVGAVHLSDNLTKVRDWLNDDGIKSLRLFRKGTILFPKSGASTFLNHRVIMGMDGYVSSHLATIAKQDDSANEKYIYYMLLKIDARSIAPDSAYPSLKAKEIAKIQIPLPPLSKQKEIVAAVEAEQKAVDGCKNLIAAMEKKIAAKIAEVWGE